MLYKVKFVSYLSKNAGISEVTLPTSVKTVDDALKYLTSEYEGVKDILIEDSPEINIIMGKQSLLIPKDLKLEITDDLILSPIIAGG